MSVRIIPPELMEPVYETKQRKASAASIKKTRVAAYARVSTALEEQESSFESQVQHYTGYIQDNPAWELAGVYADEGLSGTGTKKREQFNAMIADCRNGKIDMVITKSISRFARNTVDCLQYIRELRDKNIPVIFEKEGINTMDSSGEMLLTIMASLAQQESASISENVRLGHQYRMQQGKPMVTTHFMGYRMSADKSSLVIVPEQAVIVRRIFREFLDGRSSTQIANALMADGIKSPSGGDKWYPGCIESMLQNEKFMGDLLLQKWYIKDFISKKAVRNNGKFPKYYVENAHDPIVPKPVFLQVKGEFLRRKYRREMSGRKTLQRGSSPFYEKLICSECESTYKRFPRQPGNGYTTWRCKTRIRKGTPCNGRIVKETEVQDAVVRAFGMLPDRRAELKKLLHICEPQETELQGRMTALTERERAIHDQISEYAETGEIAAETSGTPQGTNYIGNDFDGTAKTDGTKPPPELKLERIRNELDRIHTEKNQLLRQKAEYDSRKVYVRDLLNLIDAMDENAVVHTKRSSTYQDEIRRQVKAYPASCTDVNDFFERTAYVRHHGPITEFSADDCDEFIGKIIVHKDRMTVMFRAGIVVEVRG